MLDALPCMHALRRGVGTPTLPAVRVPYTSVSASSCCVQCAGRCDNGVLPPPSSPMQLNGCTDRTSRSRLRVACMHACMQVATLRLVHMACCMPRGMLYATCSEVNRPELPVSFRVVRAQKDRLQSQSCLCVHVGGRALACVRALAAPARTCVSTCVGVGGRVACF